MGVIECLMSVVFPRQEHYAWHEYIAAFLYFTVMLSVATIVIGVIILGISTMSFDFVIGQ